MRGFLIGIVSAWALFVALAIVVDPVQADIERPTQEQLEAVWSVKAGEMHVAFRTNRIQAFYAVTYALDTLRVQNPQMAKAVARDIARNLGVIGQANDIDTDAVEDKLGFREWAGKTRSLPFSVEDQETLIDTAKEFDVVEVVEEP